MKFFKAINIGIILSVVIAVSGYGQQVITDPNGYFNRYQLKSTLVKVDGTQLQVNLIYNDGNTIYYSNSASPDVQTMAITSIRKIKYADGSEEMFYGSSLNETMPLLPPVVYQAPLASDATTETTAVSDDSTVEEVSISTEHESEANDVVIAQTPTFAQQEEPFTQEKKGRTVTTDSWLSLGNGVVIDDEYKYDGISVTWGARFDFGFFDGWLARNADLRMGLSFATGSNTYSYTYSDYDWWTDSYTYYTEEYNYEAIGFGVQYGYDFYLYQGDQFKLWTGAEVGMFMYNERMEGEEYDPDYWDVSGAYGVYAGAQYRFSPNGLGLMMEVGASTYYTVSVGLSFPLSRQIR